jgi:hypothetical protein
MIFALAISKVLIDAVLIEALNNVCLESLLVVQVSMVHSFPAS